MGRTLGEVITALPALINSMPHVSSLLAHSYPEGDPRLGKHLLTLVSGRNMKEGFSQETPGSLGSRLPCTCVLSPSPRAIILVGPWGGCGDGPGGHRTGG